MFSLRDPCVSCCSRDLDALRAQSHIRFLYLNYPQINEVGKSDHVVLKPRHETEALPIQSRSNLQQGHVTPFITLRPRISEGCCYKSYTSLPLY